MADKPMAEPPIFRSWHLGSAHDLRVMVSLVAVTESMAHLQRSGGRSELVSSQCLPVELRVRSRRQEDAKTGMPGVAERI